MPVKRDYLNEAGGGEVGERGKQEEEKKGVREREICRCFYFLLM